MRCGSKSSGGNWPVPGAGGNRRRAGKPRPGVAGPLFLRRRRSGTVPPASPRQLAYIGALVGDYNRLKGDVPGLELGECLSHLSLGEAAGLSQKEASWVIQHLRLRIECYRRFPEVITVRPLSRRVPPAETGLSRRDGTSPGLLFPVAVSELADSVVCPFRWKIRREEETGLRSFQAELGNILHCPQVLRILLDGLAFSQREKANWWRLVSRERKKPARAVLWPDAGRWDGEGKEAAPVLYEDSPQAGVLFGRSLPLYGKPDLILQRKAGLAVLEEKFRAAPLPEVPFASDLLQVKAYVWLVGENVGALLGGRGTERGWGQRGWPMQPGSLASPSQPAGLEVAGILRYCRVKPSGVQRRDFAVAYTDSLVGELKLGLERMGEAAKGRRALPGICAKCVLRRRCRNGRPQE